MNASKAFYDFNNTLEEDMFRVAQEPTLSNPGVNPPGDGWGYNYSFTVTVNDQDLNDEVNTSFWTSTDGSPPWTHRGYQNWTSDQGDHQFGIRAHGW